MKAAGLAFVFLVCTTAYAADPPCRVAREEFVEGGVAAARMTVTNDGRPCAMRFRFGGVNVPDTWKLVQPPTSGSVDFAEDEARYTPKAGFSGDDHFAVAVYGRGAAGVHRHSRNGQYDVTVRVVPPHEALR